jgi:hypothetical protein
MVKGAGGWQCVRLAPSTLGSSPALRGRPPVLLPPLRGGEKEAVERRGRLNFRSSRGWAGPVH